MIFRKEEGYPGDRIFYEVNAHNDSLCAMGMVDKSVYLLQSSEQLTHSQVYIHVLDGFIRLAWGHNPMIDQLRLCTICFVWKVLGSIPNWVYHNMVMFMVDVWALITITSMLTGHGFTIMCY